MMQIWQNLDNVSLGNDYIEAHCIILSTFKYVWKFYTKKFKISKNKSRGMSEQEV